MNEIKKILIVSGPNLENKWWHRLAKVLIYGSTIFFVIALIFNFWSQFLINFDRLDTECKGGCTYQQLVEMHGNPKLDFGHADLNTNDNHPVITWNQIVYRDYIYPVFRETLWYIIVVLGWFVFWESIVHRAIVYVVYGKKKINL
jgi:hypothetical protein